MSTGLKRAGRLIGHILLLAAVFIAAVICFEHLLTQSSTDEASSMAQSAFPLVYMQRSGVSFNALHGYAQEMDPTAFRSSITPLGSDRTIDIEVDTFSGSIESLSYQVYDLDGEELENTQVLHLSEESGIYTASLQLQNKLLMDQEYVLCLKAVSAGKSIYYYTHVLLADGLHTDDYLNFVNGFYDKTVNGTDLESIAAAVEPDETTDQDQTLAVMDIHDSVYQLTWGDLNPQIYYKPTPQITEINDNTATITMFYRIAAVNDSGQTERYNVSEYYRLRFTDSRVFLLNFERTTDEIFDPDNDVLSSTGIRLGITGKEINYMADEKMRVVAFVQENALWSYERSSGTLRQIFSFPQDENIDARDFYDGHEITLLKVESNGDVWFCVSGYMNRGAHEGENGVDLCFYEAATDTLDEMLFLASQENPDLLMRSASESAYISGDGGTFSVLVEGTLYQVDTSVRTYEILAQGISEGCWASAQSSRYFAYLPEGQTYGSSQLIQVDLETGQSVTIDAPDGEKIRPVAYMNDDLVYGLAKDTDLENAALDTGYFPMYCLKIVDGDGEELKSYAPDGLVVTDVVQSDHMLSLTRMSRGQDGTFSAADADQIMDTNTESAVSLGTATKTSSRKQTEVYLRVGDSLSETTADVVYASVLDHTESRVLALPETRDQSGYYLVYAGGGLYDIFSRVNEAVACADEQVGVVLDGAWRYVWVRGDKETSAEISLDKVPDVMKAGVSDLETLAEGVDGDVLDLTGCTLEQVLYLVSHGTPVAAMTADGPVTIVGYDSYNTYLLDPDGEEWYYYGMNDSTEMFAAAGNVFYSYLS